MTKAEVKAIARAIRDAYHLGPEAEHRKAARTIAEVLSELRPKLNRVQFILDCGVRP